MIRIRYVLIAGIAGLGALGYFFTQQEPIAPSAPIAGKPMPVATRRQGLNPFDSPFGLGAGVTLADGLAAGADAEIVYGRGGRAVDFGGKSARQLIEQWSGAARNGDKDAAYKVYQAESVCATNDDAVADYQSEADRQQFLRERAALEKLCAGVTPVQVQERMTFLAAAARGGKSDAQIDFYMEGLDGKPGQLAAKRDDPELMQWKKDALGFLKNSAGQGEPLALGLLSLAYGAGQMAPRDPKMALAYKVAETSVRGTPLSANQLQNRFGKQMTPSDFNDALHMGAQIARDCCQK